MFKTNIHARSNPYTTYPEDMQNNSVVLLRCNDLCPTNVSEFEKRKRKKTVHTQYYIDCTASITSRNRQICFLGPGMPFDFRFLFIERHSVGARTVYINAYCSCSCRVHVNI